VNRARNGISVDAGIGSHFRENLDVARNKKKVGGLEISGSSLSIYLKLLNTMLGRYLEEVI
jgi:hypothetical protein